MQWIAMWQQLFSCSCCNARFPDASAPPPPSPPPPLPPHPPPLSLQAVPVYTHMEAEDYLIRGYAKCDAYNGRVSSWYNSPEFVAKSQQTEALRWALCRASAALACRPSSDRLRVLFHWTGTCCFHRAVALGP
jgi:hypothetical protein